MLAAVRSVGLILAGGSSTRMGTDKAEVEVEGIAMIDRIADILLEQVDEVIVVGGDRPGALEDLPGAYGPLAGLAVGLANADGADAIFVTAVDQPYLRSETIRRLLNRFERTKAIVPVADGVRQVLCAVYPPIWAEQAEFEATQDNPSVQSLVERLGFISINENEWASWDEDGRSWFSVDSPTRLEEAVRRFGAE